MFSKRQTSLLVRLALIFMMTLGTMGLRPIQPVHAASYLVTNTNDSGIGSLRQAILEAASGDVITFHPSLSGKTITLLSYLDTITRDLTIDGSALASRIKISGNNSVSVFAVDQASVTFKNLIITNGGTVNDWGGGIANYNGIVDIIDCVLTGNSASEGGGIYNIGTLNIVKSTISSNHSDYGGGIRNAGTLNMSKSVLSDNSSGFGGGIQNDAGDVSSTHIINIVDSIFSNNSAVYSGGGISSNNGMIQIANSSFSGNTATETGGGIYTNISGGLRITNSSFSNNSAAESGGGAIITATDLLVENSTFTNNSGSAIRSAAGTVELTGSTFSGNTGSAVLSGYGSLRIENSTFAENVADLAGGLESYADDLVLVNNTFSNNQGGAVYINSGKAVIQNNIIANSTMELDCYNDGSTITSANNLIENNGLGDHACGTPAISTDPQLGPLQENGGLTKTMALDPGSPAINAGVDMNCSATDQRGVSRPQGPYCDIGAYEFVPAAPVILAVTKTVDTDDGMCNEDCSLREAISNSYDGDTIKFSISGNIVLGSSLPAINKRLVIDGSEQKIALDGARSYRIFKVTTAGNLTVKNLTFQNGKPAAPCEFDIDMPSCGGAIYTDGSLTVINSTFSGNTASTGGAIWIQAGTANIESSTFKGNSATSTGGAILNLLGVANIVNSTFYGNTAGDLGGAILNDINLLNLKSNTFSNNSAALGGAVYNSAGTMIFANNILANSPSGGDCYNEYPWGEISLNANNLIETNAASPNHCGSASFIADPKLGPLADNGGPTQTIALLADSPAIDTGNNSACPTTDQRGVDRPQGSHCDIGAYEYAPDIQSVLVKIGNAEQGSYWLNPSQSKRKSYTGLNNGPVIIENLSGSLLIASQRVIYGGWSYSEMMGLPFEQLTKEYLFPYYNNVAMDSQLRVSNVGGADTTIKVYLGADPNPIDSYTLAAGGATRKNYPGKNSGPLRVTSSASNILTTIRVLYGGSSYSEMMGLPVEQLAKEYLFSYYNNVAMDSQLRVSNVGGTDTTIKVYLGADLTPIDSYTLAAGGATRKNYTGKNSGPLRVTSSDSDILTTIRMLYAGSSLSELMGFPANQLSQSYWYPVYDNAALDSQLRVSNVGSATTHITVYAGTEQIDSYDLGKGAASRKNYPKNTGPLHVVSSTQPILTTVRLLYGSSLYEMTGLPEGQLSTQYFFPWYNNYAMNSELRLAVP